MKIKLIISTTLLILSVSILVYAYSTGITDKTRKSSTPGCTCHGISPSNQVSVTITGPDTLQVNQAANYTITITGGPLVRGGTNIATESGTLGTINNLLRSENGELTHTTPITPSGGSVQVQFSYTAPSTPGVDTIYANGNSVNFNGSASGDSWNFAPEKIVIIVQSIGINTISTEVPEIFSLMQNYPNPFNPTTKIQFSIPSSQFVVIKIFNVTGREVATLVNEQLKPGTYEVDFPAPSEDGSRFSSGVYFYKLTAGEFTESKKMILIR